MKSGKNQGFGYNNHLKASKIKIKEALKKLQPRIGKFTRQTSGTTENTI